MNLIIAPQKSGEINIDFSSILGENFIQAVQEMAEIRNNLMEEQNPSTELSDIFQSELIQKELDSNYFSNSQIIFPNNSAVYLRTKIPHPEKLSSKLISVQKLQNNLNRITINISYENLKDSILKENSYVKNFADILMAPLFTGEEMDIEEYTDLLISVYGEALTEEILSRDLVLTFKSENNIREIAIPLEKLLVSKKGLSFSFDY